jgi:CubicO group peptidase (beta-lactamase class C family)
MMIIHSFVRVPVCGILAIGALACAPTRTAPPPVQATSLTASIDSVAASIFSLDASPGVGIVVVRDTQVIYVKGFGHADVEANRPVTPETEFYIASTTKSFTGLVAAILDLQGAMKLDAPISRYLPMAKLRAPMNPDSITVRSLLTHTHGIGAGPVAMRLAYTGEYEGDDELVRLLSEHSPNPAGRSYSYTNLGYNIVGLAMRNVTGESWKETLQRTLFTPLGMTRTSAYVSGRSPDRLAMPYLTTPEGFVRTRYGKTDANMQSAGGLITTPLDMGRWLEAHINEGRLDGRQVLPAPAVAESHRILAPISGSTRGVRNLGYGLGWQISLVGSDTLLHHGGGFPGFATHMSFMPQHRVGVAVMTNNGELGGPLAELLAMAIYDVLRGRPAITADSVAAIGRQLVRMRGQLAASLAQRAKRPQNLPFPLDAYIGRFHNPVMGHLELRLVNGKLEARMGAAWSAVEVYDNTKNQLRVELFGGGEVVTVTMKDGRAESLELGGLTYSRVP